jgi:hypothetical protein
MPKNLLAVAGFVSRFRVSTDLMKDIQELLAGCIAISYLRVILFLGWILVQKVEINYNSGLSDPRNKPF